jgi:hypothetical protein
MRYVLAGIAGLWMVDGLALVLAPRRIVAHVQEALRLLLLVGAQGFGTNPYGP